MYKITLELTDITGWTIVTSWKIVNKFLKEAFKEYNDEILGYKIEKI